MRINQVYWEIETAGWAIDQSPECVTLNPYDVEAALQVSCHTKRVGDVTHEDLAHFARKALEPHEVDPTPITCGDYRGLYGSFVDSESRFWRQWFLGFGPVSLYVTYNAHVSHADDHTAVVDWMLSGLRAINLPTKTN